MANVYDIVNGLSDLKFYDIPVKAGQLDADMSRGRWVYMDATEEAVVAPASPANMNHSVYRPIWSGKEKPDSEETNLVTTVYGEHEAYTDEYVADPTVMVPARPVWAALQSLVVVDGELVPYLAGTDDEQAIVGHMVAMPDSNGRMRIHING